MRGARNYEVNKGAITGDKFDILVVYEEYKSFAAFCTGIKMLSSNSGYILSKNPKKCNICHFDLVSNEKKENNLVSIKPLQNQATDYYCDPIIKTYDNQISHNLYFRNPDKQMISCLSQPQNVISNLYSDKSHLSFLDQSRNTLNQMRMDCYQEFVFLNNYTHMLIFQTVDRGNLKKIAKIEFSALLDKSFEIACFDLVKNGVDECTVIAVTKSDILEHNCQIYSLKFDLKNFRKKQVLVKNYEKDKEKEREREKGKNETFFSFEKKRTGRSSKTDQSDKLTQFNLQEKLKELHIDEQSELESGRNIYNVEKHYLKQEKLENYVFKYHPINELSSKSKSKPHLVKGETRTNCRYFVVSTVCEESTRLCKLEKNSKKMKKQHELMLFQVFSDDRIEHVHSLEFQSDHSFTNRLLPTCYSHINLDVYLNGCLIIICYEGLHPLLTDQEFFQDFINPEDRSVKKMGMDIYAVYESKMIFKQRIDRFSQGGVYGSDYLEGNGSGDSSIWSVDASGVICQIKIEQKNT